MSEIQRSIPVMRAPLTIGFNVLSAEFPLSLKFSTAFVLAHLPDKYRH